MLFLSPELKEEHNKIKTLHKFPEENAMVLGSIAMEIKENKIDEVMAKIDEIMKAHPEYKNDKVSIVADGKKLCIGIALPKL